MEKTLKEKIAGVLKTYQGNQARKDSTEITFKDGLGLILNFLNLEDEVKRTEKFEIKCVELEACLNFANKKIIELQEKVDASERDK